MRLRSLPRVEHFTHSQSVHSPVFKMFAAALLAIVVDYVMIFGLSTTGRCLLYHYRPLQVAEELLGRGQDIVISYLGLPRSIACPAELCKDFGFLSVLTVLAPLLFARQMFLRSQALEEAHKDLQLDREQVLRTLSNAMAEERADERQKLKEHISTTTSPRCSSDCRIPGGRRAQAARQR